jgi:hypothetical protein
MYLYSVANHLKKLAILLTERSEEMFILSGMGGASLKQGYKVTGAEKCFLYYSLNPVTFC